MNAQFSIKHPLYLVPFDFTSTSLDALDLSLELARMNDGSVFLLHVVKNEKDKPAIRRKFDAVIAQHSKEDQARIYPNTTVGNIYEDVGKASELLRASLIVLGTHGAKGMQKVFGSHVERLVTSSSTPLLITQEKKNVEDIQTIVLPFNFNKESLQVSKFAGAMAKKFNASVHLVGQHDKVERHEAKMNVNEDIVTRYLEELGVPFKIVNLPGKAAFEKEMVDYSGEIDADIIAVTYSNDSFLPRANTVMQGIFENEYHIPVLTINTEEVSQTYY